MGNSVKISIEKDFGKALAEINEEDCLLWLEMLCRYGVSKKKHKEILDVLNEVGVRV